MTKAQAPTTSAWQPLRHGLFRSLWLASIASSIGTWMHEVGAGWLMTSLSASPFMVSLVQVAGAAPMFLLALPAGALADIIDKRRYLLAVQAGMAVIALARLYHLCGPDERYAFTPVYAGHGDWNSADHASMVSVDTRVGSSQ
jgi:MFS family permease